MPEIRIRRATVDDLWWIVRELKAFSNEYGSKHELFKSEEHCHLAMAGMVNDHLVFVAEQQAQDGMELMGLIAGFVVKHPFNPDIRLLAETFWWVSKKHRTTRAGFKLLDSFISWGRENVDWITFGTMTTT
ncbi:MAG: hypothetical protein E6Q97_37375, partial [Desulfurellales bacterium]